eukprot:579897-Hanusia_phi.AAC.4
MFDSDCSETFHNTRANRISFAMTISSSFNFYFIELRDFQSWTNNLQMRSERSRRGSIEVSEVQWHNMSAADSQVTLDMHINANDIRHHAQLYGSTVEFHLFKLLSSDIESGQSKLLRRKGLCGLEEIVVHGSMKSSYKLRIQSQHPSSSLPPAASADTCSSSSSVCTDQVRCLGSRDLLLTGYQADLTPRRNASSTLKDTPGDPRAPRQWLADQHVALRAEQIQQA